MRSRWARVRLLALPLMCLPQAACASEEWMVAPSGARLKLTGAKFRYDFESCLADCGSGASLAIINSLADQQFVNERLLNKTEGGAYNVLIGNYRLKPWTFEPPGFGTSGG